MKNMTRIISCEGITVGCWLDAIASSPDYTLSNAEFFMSFLLRLGASLSALRAIDRCIAQCGELLITLDAISLHASLEEVLFIDTIESYNTVHQMLFSVGLQCRKEVTKQFEGKQRPDITVYNFDNGKKLLLDITIAHPWAQNYIGRSCTTAGLAVNRTNNNKYLQMSTALGYLFRPFSL